MNQLPIHPKQFLISLRIIHFALIVGQLIFAGIVIYLVDNGSSPNLKEYNNVFLIIAIFFTFGAIFAGNTIYKSKLKAILPGEKVIEKLQIYRVTLIIKYGILEGAAMFSIVAYFLIANFLFLIFLGVIIAAFLFSTPSVDKIVLDLKLSANEKDEIIKMAENYKR